MSSYVAGVVDLIQMAFASYRSLGGISPVPMPARAVMPYITVRQAGGKEAESLSGPSGIISTLMRVSCYSGSYEEAWELREAVKSALLRYTGMAGDQIIQAVSHAGDAELHDATLQKHQLVSSFSIWWDSNV